MKPQGQVRGQSSVVSPQQSPSVYAQSPTTRGVFTFTDIDLQLLHEGEGVLVTYRLQGLAGLAGLLGVVSGLAGLLGVVSGLAGLLRRLRVSCWSVFF